MKLIIATLVAFVLFDNFCKLSAKGIISTIETDVERGIKVLPKVIRDSAPIVGRLPVSKFITLFLLILFIGSKSVMVGPAATLGRIVGTDIRQAFHPRKMPSPYPGYPRIIGYRPRLGGYRGYQPFYHRAGGIQRGFYPGVTGTAIAVNNRPGEFPRRIATRAANREFQRIGRVGDIAVQQGMYSNVGNAGYSQWPQYNQYNN